MASKSKAASAAKAVEETPELVTPEEHAETTDSVDVGEHVSAPDVPNDVEIGARSADMDEPSNEHVKVFVLGPNPVANDSNPYTVEAGYDHEPNKAATRQYMIDAGLWPTTDVRHVSTVKHPDGASWILTYAVDAIPANDAPEGSQTPHVVAEDGDAEGAINYSPPSDVAEHADQTATATS